MKKILLIIAILFSGFCIAQQTHDLFMYTPPSGWKKEIKNGMVSYTTTDSKKGTYCLISLYSATDGKGGIQADFDNDWQELVAKPLGVTAVPQSSKAEAVNGWEVMNGVATFSFGGGTSIVMLTTFSGYGKATSMLCVLNDQAYQKDLEDFLSKLDIKKPSVAIPPQNTTPPNASTNNSIIGEWSTTGTVIANYVNGSGQYTGDASISTTHNYKFNSNGTYESFFATTTGFKTHTFYYKGKYTTSGNQITTTPTFYQHKLNTKLQPNNDPNNMKKTVSQYVFEYDNEKQKTYMKLQGIGDDYTGVHNLFKSGNETVNTTTVPSQNNTVTSATSSSFNFLTGTGITGVWVIYAKPSITENLQWNWFVFFSNGKSLQNMPQGGFANLPNGSYYDVNRNTPEYWPVGSYSFANGNGKNKKREEVSYQETLRLVKPNQLTINGTAYFKCINVNGQKLNGSFTSFANPNDPQLQTLRYGEKPVLTFFTNGKFKDEGLFNTYLFDGGTNPEAAKPGNGTYELKEYTIILKYDDGHIRQEAFTIPFSNNTNEASIILISRAQINKIK